MNLFDSFPQCQAESASSRDGRERQRENLVTLQTPSQPSIFLLNLMAAYQEHFILQFQEVSLVYFPGIVFLSSQLQFLFPKQGSCAITASLIVSYITCIASLGLAPGLEVKNVILAWLKCSQRCFWDRHQNAVNESGLKYGIVTKKLKPCSF